MSIHILKFGGTSVSDGERIRHVATIIAQQINDVEETFPVVVVSAMAGITDQLLRIAQYACIQQLEECQAELRALKQRHQEATGKAVYHYEGRQALYRELEKAFTALECDVVTCGSGQVRDLPLRVAAVAAWGERLSALLLAAAAQDSGLQASAVDEEVIITSLPRAESVSQLGFVVGADPLRKETRVNAQRLLFPLIERRIVPIVAGFIGRTVDGFVTTLGRNGSDYSAAVIGAALDCVGVSIYTDVDGVLTADPRVVANARLLPELSYTEVVCLSWFGAKVLHPKTLLPLARRNIPVHVRNTFRPQTRGTVVGPERTQRSAATAITVLHQLTLITVENTEMFGTSEHMEQVFLLAAHAGVAPVAVCSSYSHLLSFVVEEEKCEAVIALLQHKMGAWRVLCRRGLATCACIGSGFTADLMSAARAITALAGEHIAIITQGMSELGIILLVEDQDSERAVRCLHRVLIESMIPQEELLSGSPQGAIPTITRRACEAVLW